MKKKVSNHSIEGALQKYHLTLTKFLKKHPEQWEGWFYIDKFFKTENIEKVPAKKIENFSKKVKLCMDEFIYLMKYDDERIFLVSKKDYQIMKITNSLYEILDFFKTPKQLMSKKAFAVGNQTVDWNVVTELIEMNFLKPV
ncbi:MAG: hypothetical protein LBE36_11280 [Flavobacteriaceae bacterium]|nr:hypothetical protein [Flavobacteriaceae bacterium]